MAYTVTAEKMVCGGDCLAHLNGKNIFIPFAIPGEKYEIEITKELRDYAIAKITRIVEASPHRVEPFCPHYGICGGCNMQHISPDYQRTLRTSILKDCFEREGIVIEEIIPVYGSDKGYRSRIQLTNGGFNEKQSNNIISLLNCSVATPELNEYFKETVQAFRPKGRVHLFGDSRVAGEEKVKIADESVNAKRNDVKTYKKNSGKTLKNKVKHRFAGTTSDISNACDVSILNKNIKFNVQGFFQSNLEVLEKTIEQVTYNLEGNNVLDMYAGCGTFSVFLADRFNKTTMVEHNRDALVYAEMNMNGKNHETYGLSGEKWAKEIAPSTLAQQGNFDAVVIDPPRSGMEKEVNQWLCHNKTFQIRSVSCDPATHARDAAKLIKAGYRLSKLFLLDFYPQTAHIESLAYFENEN